MCVCMCVRVRTLSCSVGSYSLWPHGLWDARLSVGFPRQEYWSGLPFPNPGDLPNPGTEPMSLASPAFVGRFFTIAPPGKPHMIWRTFTPLILSPVWKLLRGRDYSPFPPYPRPAPGTGMFWLKPWWASLRGEWITAWVGDPLFASCTLKRKHTLHCEDEYMEGW